MPIKAFLSHSSRDKFLVESVFEQLGAGIAQVDSEAIEGGKRTAEEILRMLDKSSVFVLFVSKHSLDSGWVKAEIREAHHRISATQKCRILPIVIDGIERLGSGKVIARRIRSAVIEAQLAADALPPPFLGRDSEAAELRTTLAKPRGELPHVIAVSGWDGIGRRTFALKAIRDVYQYLPVSNPEVILQPHYTIDDFYRAVVDQTESLSLADWRSRAKSFAALSLDGKTERTLEVLRKIHDAKEILFIVDDNALIRDDGAYHDWFRELMQRIDFAVRPIAVVIQTRMLHFRFRSENKWVKAIRLESLKDEDVATILGLQFNAYQIDFKEEDLNELAQFMDGHPLNVKFAVEFAREYGVDQLMIDKSDLLRFKIRRSSDLLDKIQLSDIERRILAVVLSYRMLKLEDVPTILGISDEHAAGEIRALQDKALLERVSGHLRVAPYVRDALSRRISAAPDEDWMRDANRRIADLIASYRDDDAIPLALIDAAILSEAREKGAAFRGERFHELLLPSHLLRIAREAYDSSQHKLAASLADLALSRGAHLTAEARVEALRLIGMSFARLGKFDKLEDTLAKIKTVAGRVARRNYWFIKGFGHRLRGHIDDAETAYVEAHKLGPGNFHILRELAHVLSQQDEHEEAERYARDAWKIAPTNPYVIDTLCHIVIGQAENKEDLVGNDELKRLLDELRKQDEARKSTFYPIRMAQYHLVYDDYPSALEWADKAVKSNPKLFSSYATRASVRLRAGMAHEVEGDITAMRRIASDANTGEGKSLSFLSTKFEILRWIELRKYAEAKKLIESSASLPARLRQKLRIELAEAISWDSAYKDTDLKQWAKRALR